MDADTEKELAELILEEAKLLRLRAEREGVQAYLEKPKARGRPNSQFLTATVRSVQQANRMVEVNEMWRLREKELELEKRMRGKRCSSKREKSPCYQAHDKIHRNDKGSQETFSESKLNRSQAMHHQKDLDVGKDHRDREGIEVEDELSYKSQLDDHFEDEGLQDDELQEFLQSRVKRGRGAIGSRMDETGPYPVCLEGETSYQIPLDQRLKEDWENRIVGPSLLESESFKKESAKLKRTRSEEYEKLDIPRPKGKRKHGSERKHSSKNKKHSHKKKSDKSDRRKKKKCKHIED
eukprot:TRINITY_DN7220_c0_g1_i1.p1 TRINITY_DN7220_c0_g1~~TRINITY_DN7220_c0_g1_i1.p1  ORF type:complete len:294 (-),score=62.79 TRINITY_DN7220_c0_g1_i1:160-1041(-)